MAKTSPKPDPEYNRAIIRAALIEGGFIVLGVIAYLSTQQVWLLVAAAAIGAAIFLVIFQRASKAFRERQAGGGQASIVQDGGV